MNPNALATLTRASRRVWIRCRAVAGSVALAAALAGCGGGVYVGIDGNDDDPPQVSLSVSPGAQYEGGPIDLFANASDDYAMRRVDFYRFDSLSPGNQPEFIGSDFAYPYELRTIQPDTPDGGVSYSARAIDDVGQFTDSAWVVVTVLR